VTFECLKPFGFDKPLASTLSEILSEKEMEGLLSGFRKEGGISSSHFAVILMRRRATFEEPFTQREWVRWINSRIPIKGGELRLFSKDIGRLILSTNGSLAIAYRKYLVDDLRAFMDRMCYSVDIGNRVETEVLLPNNVFTGEDATGTIL
jgi:hypothetical protein